LNDLDRIEQPFINALDDYHRIKETAVLKQPSMAMHLVIIGRAEVQSHVALSDCRKMPIFYRMTGKSGQ